MDWLFWELLGGDCEMDSIWRLVCWCMVRA